MRYLLTITACMVMACGLMAADDAAVKKDLKALAGKWKAVSGERAGVAIPEGQVPSLTFTVNADGIAKVQHDGGDFEVRLTIDPTKKPKTMTADHQTGADQGKTQYLIYKIDGDKLTVVGPGPGEPESNRPKEFTTKDTECMMIVFERIK